MLIILSGPPGSGKSTIANLLANKFQKSVNFSVDAIRRFVIAGNFAPWDSSPKAKKQHKLTDKIVIMIIEQYINGGYTVILDGIYGDRELLKFKKIFKEVYGFILLPKLTVTKNRDKFREKDKQVPHRVKPLHDHFSNARYKHFVMIDSSDLDPKQTLRIVLTKIKQY